MAFFQTAIMTPSPSIQPPAAVKSRAPLFNDRSRRQLGLFIAGAGFFGASMAITRRSLVRRYKASIPKFYQPNNQPAFEVNGAVEALEALSLATINVFSVGIMASGGLLWAFDIASLDDIRRKVRKNMSVAPSREDKEAEEEVKEWFSTVLSRKEFKHLKEKETEKRDITRDDADKKS